MAGLAGCYCQVLQWQCGRLQLCFVFYGSIDGYEIVDATGFNAVTCIENDDDVGLTRARRYRRAG